MARTHWRCGLFFYLLLRLYIPFMSFDNVKRAENNLQRLVNDQDEKQTGHPFNGNGEVDEDDAMRTVVETQGLGLDRAERLVKKLVYQDLPDSASEIRTRGHDVLKTWYAVDLDNAIENAVLVLRRVDANFAWDHPLVSAGVVTQAIKSGSPQRLMQSAQDLAANQNKL